MENDQDNIIESQNDEIELDLDNESVEEQTKQEVKEQKPKLSDEELLAQLEGRANRLRTKLGKGKQEDAPTEQKVPSKSGELDYGQKAYLVANGIKGDEMSLVKEELARSGMELDDLLENPYFQSRLTAHRESKATNEAVPKGSKRTTQSPKDSVEFWLSKPFDEVPSDMKRKVLDARLQKEKNDAKFSSNSVVIG